MGVVLSKMRLGAVVVELVWGKFGVDSSRDGARKFSWRGPHVKDSINFS